METKARANSSSGVKRRLRRYRGKRTLASSGEPAGKKAVVQAKFPRYVIQKHDATRLHYDFRLEMGGVYRSWAVPKGMPEAVGAKSLAIEVEDHPLDYGTFEGTIPAGNYGAGTVMLWDRGFYTVPEGTSAQGYRAGKLHLVLAGEKCRGEWTLVRMAGAKGEKSQWLLIKNDDKIAAPIRKRGRDLSVKTGRTLAAIATA